ELAARDEDQLAAGKLEALQAIQHVRRHDAVVGDGSVVIERNRGVSHGTPYRSPGLRINHKRRAHVSKNGKRAFIGIDIGGTKSLFALFDESFEVLAEQKFRTHPEKGGVRAFNRKMSASVKHLLTEARARVLKVKVVGVGCAGDIDMKAGAVRASPNLPFLDDYSFRTKLERLTGARVFVGHDVQTALYGEFRLGAARKARNVIGIWIGTGVGGALILDGRLYLGASGAAGDIGNYLLHAMDVS